MRNVAVVAARVGFLFALVGVAWTSLSPVDRLPDTANVSDKVLHLLAYSVLGVLAALAQRRSRILLTIALLTAFGYAIEVLQGRSGYREFDLRDLLADALGAAFGVLLVAVLRTWAQHDDGDMTEDTREWDDRYGSEQIWSGQPNGALVAEVGGMPPGRVLDVGCGEGADAVWLAQRGWTVTALDVSGVAIDRAQRAAAQAGVSVTWLNTGLVESRLASGAFDLVSVQYPALRRTVEHDSEHALLSAVAAGGTLLVVLHADMDGEQARSHGFDPDDYVGHDQILAVLGDDWLIETNERRSRSIEGGGGAHHSHDVVLRARRLR